MATKDKPPSRPGPKLGGAAGPSEKEVDELLHYYCQIPNALARRKVISAARLASPARPIASVLSK